MTAAIVCWGSGPKHCYQVSVCDVCMCARIHTYVYICMLCQSMHSGSPPVYLQGRLPRVNVDVNRIILHCFYMYSYFYIDNCQTLMWHTHGCVLHVTKPACMRYMHMLQDTLRADR